MLQEFKEVLNIIENHYCKGSYQDKHGNYCALGAISQVVCDHNEHERSMRYANMSSILSEACYRRYGEASVADVNDFGGKELIIACIHDVIATLEEESQGEELAPIEEESKTKTLERV